MNMFQLTRTVRYFVAPSLLLFLFSCQKEYSNPTSDFESEIEQEFIENPDQSRFSSANKLLIWHGNGLVKDGFTSNQVDERDGGETPNDDIYWLHVGDVGQLNYEGQLLSASNIVVKDNIAYIGYHTRGTVEKGAIETLDLTDPENPLLISQVFFDNSEVTSIEVDQNAPKTDTRVWVGLTSNKSGASLGQYEAQNGVLTWASKTARLSDFLPEGFTANANSIKHAGSYLHVTSGREYGGVFVLDPDNLEVIGKTVFSDAKYVAANGNETGTDKVVVLKTGESAALRVANLGETEFPSETPIGQIVHQNTDANGYGKSNLRFEKEGSDILYASMGKNGIKAFRIGEEAEEIWQSPSDMIKSGNCNSVTTDGDFLYAANGADGLAVFQLIDNEAPRQVFTWDLSEQDASANFVEAFGDYIFVAKGQGGVKILKRPAPGDLLPLVGYNPNGTPIELAEPIQVCETLLPTIYADALPESQNATVAHPEFFAHDVAHNIVLNEDCEVYITFLNEAAGYTNTLGYYYYDADNPPASLDELTKIIVFPNASKAGSGGELVPGSTMELLGTFNENTVIGFFLISNGWQNGQITNGLYTVYSDPIFNPQNKVQSLIFHDPTCSSTVLCFEDILTTTGGDKDFNDVMFQVTTSPASAINKDLYLQL